MKHPLVSIVLPAYNRSVFLARAVNSIRSQTFHDFELIVVDDGSSDDTADVAADLASCDQRIQVIKHLSNRGAQAARNTGIRTSRGEWIAFQDSDDEWLPGSLEARLSVAESRRFPVVYSDCILSRTNRFFGIPLKSGMVYRELLARPGPMFQSLLVRAAALSQMGNLDEDIDAYQEWDTAIRLAKQNEFGYVGEPTYIYHQNGQATISSNLQQSARGYEQIIQKHAYEMKKHLGRSGLAKHRLRAAYYHLRAGGYRSAGTNLFVALKSLF
jgi:glycosyltransferase involved in cell wall biosynthesis